MKARVLLILFIFSIAVRNSKEDNVMDLTLSKNGLYLASISLGFPPQSFKALIDLNSGDFWVMDSQCMCTSSCNFLCRFRCEPQCCEKKIQNTELSSESYKNVFMNKSNNEVTVMDSSCKTKNRFYSSKSTSFKKGNYYTTFHNNNSESNNFRIDYPHNDFVKGFSGSDVATLNGKSCNGVEFGLIKEMPQLMEKENFDGILGLGKFGENFKTNTLINNVIKQKHLTENIVSIYINSNTSLEASPGTITFGKIDNENCGLIAQIVPKLSDSSWSFGIDKITFNKNIWKKNVTVTIDLTVNHITLPKEISDKLKDLPGATYSTLENSYYIPCDTEFTFYISIGRYNYPISSSNLINENVKDKSGKCKLELIPQIKQNSNFILGIPFFKQYCVILDYEDKIMFATSMEQ